MTQDGTKEITELFESKIFGFPKPTALVKYFIKAATAISKDDGNIILDFFSGSATTAHAVMQLNAEDSGNRRFICVQLPEVTDEKSEAFKAGYANICEIGKERIRRAGAKIKADSPLTTGELDTGFRVFKLDSSNLKVWNDSPITGENAAELFEQRLLDYLDVLVDGRTDVDVVYEVMLKLGQDLCEPISVIELAKQERSGRGSATSSPLDGTGNRKVYGVGEDVKFIVCLAAGITPEDANEMAEYAPGRIIFAEQCFNDTEGKSNVRLQLKDKGIAIKTL
jgi:adenine-specific DNA-methyltransferase